MQKAVGAFFAIKAGPLTYKGALFCTRKAPQRRHTKYADRAGRYGDKGRVFDLFKKQLYNFITFRPFGRRYLDSIANHFANQSSG
jgi:hypothetical protein